VTEDRVTVGVVTPHAAPGPEVELPAMTGGRVVTTVFRTGSLQVASQSPSPADPPAHAALRAATGPAAFDHAAMAFAGTTLAAIAHASTTCGYVIGQREEADLVDRLSQRFGVPAVASCAAVVAALRTHEVRRVQLVHPPWFDDEFSQLGTAYFRSQGFDPVVTQATGLTTDPARVDPHRVVDWVEQHVEDRADAIFLAGNGFRTAGAVEELELRTGRLVVAANQALLWGVLKATSLTWDITGHGRLLRDGTSTHPSRDIN
jgi:maleate isomerase